MAHWINRSAYLVRFREPYLKWAAGINAKAGDHLTSWRDNISVYLVAEDPKGEEDATPLEDYFEEIFDRELEAWCPDESFWPQNRTFELFNQWFKVDVQGIVTDLDSDQLERENI